MGRERKMVPIDEFYVRADEGRDGLDVRVSNDLWVRVYSVKASHASRFSEGVQDVLSELYKVSRDARGQVNEQGVVDNLGRLVPAVLGRLSGLVEQACVAWRGSDFDASDTEIFEGQPALGRLELATQAAVVEAWLRQSFREEKLRPLAALVGTLVSRATGKEMNLSRMWSHFSSPSDTTGTTFSSGTAAPGGPTAAGASGSSGPTPEPPSGTPPTEP